MVGFIIKAEGLSVFLTSLYLYNSYGGSWILFIVLLFTPDISIIGYFKDNKTGSVVYNAVHNYVLGLATIISGMVLGSTLLTSVGLILSAHVGMDRFFGFGLKYPAGFKKTHLQKL